MQRYEKYKNSGVDWIGEIPEHWEILKLKFLFKDVSIKNKPDLELLSVTQDKGVIPRNMVESRMVMPTGNLESFKVICKGDFAISLRSFEGGLEYSEYDGIISPAYTVLKSQKEINDNYFKFLFKSKAFIAELQLSIVGIREGKNISYEELKYSYTPIPTLPEQQTIATFLDDKTAKIGQTIANKQKEIELLKERRQILIQKAVTKGLDDTAPLKDSGVDWIGEIPEHWEVRKLKFHTSKIGSGVTPSGGATTYLDEGIPLLRSQNVYFDRFEFENVAYISEKTHNEMSNSKVQKNDILLNITGGSIGRCNIFKYYFEANVNQHVCIVRPKNIIPNYLNSLLSSSLGQFQVFFQQQGGGREGLNFQNLKNFYFPIPPLAEQTNIVSYLQKIEEKIAKAILLKQQEIDKLKEYKTVLIDNVVTGKVRVS